MTGSSIQVPRVPELSLQSQKSLERFAKSIDTNVAQQTKAAVDGLASAAQLTTLQNSINAILQQLAALQKQVNNTPAGKAGATGAPGSALFVEAEPGEEWIPIPGAAGMPGAAGATGGVLFLDPEQGEDGAPGVPGASGPQGLPGAVMLVEADAGEDAMPIPGAPGAPGAQGLQGVPGAVIFMDADVVDDSVLSAPFSGQTNLQSDELATTTSAGPYPLALIPDGRLVIVTLGSGRVPPTQYSFTGASITFSGAAATALAAGSYSEGSVNYSY